MTSEVSRFISNTRFPLILGPVLIHCHWPGLEDSYFQYICIEVGWITVPLFFSISGFLLFQNFDGSASCYKKKMESRVYTLLIPYLVWNLIAYIFFAYIDRQIAPQHFIQSFFALPEMSGGPADHPLWFLRNIIVYTLLAPLVYWFVKQRFAGVILVSILAIWLLGLPLLQHGIMIGGLFFVWGGYISVKQLDVKLPEMKRIKALSIIVMMIFIASIIISACLNTKDTYWGQVVYNAVLLSGMALIYFLFSSISKDSIVCQLLIKLGGLSFFVYCSHVFFIRPIQQLIEQYLGATSLSYIVVFVFVSLSCILLGITLQRSLPKVYSFITGSRK